VANALLVRMSPRQAERLAQMPGVRGIHPVYRVKLLLDYAVVQHSVDAVWNEISTERAGAGVKIGIIDTGIDPAHPAFQDPALQSPLGYPLLNQEADRAATNSKIIVARNYEPVYGVLALDARDTNGHGTAVAMAAAGLPVASPTGIISGVAPKAFLGSYKVFPSSDDFARSDVVLKAFEDAVNDGMDVVNLSLGSALAPRPRDDIFTEAVERAASLGVIVVAATGNEGPDPNTIGTSGNAPSAIGVGALENRRTFAGKALIPGDSPYVAIPGDGPAPPGPVTAPMLDVATLDGNGLACNPFAASSLSGRIAFILRGECFFETKLNNA
jgi:subtilisin family serine protease